MQISEWDGEDGGGGGGVGTGGVRCFFLKGLGRAPHLSSILCSKCLVLNVIKGTAVYGYWLLDIIH